MLIMKNHAIGDGFASPVTALTKVCVMLVLVALMAGCSSVSDEATATPMRKATATIAPAQKDMPGESTQTADAGTALPPQNAVKPSATTKAITGVKKPTSTVGPTSTPQATMTPTKTPLPPPTRPPPPTVDPRLLATQQAMMGSLQNNPAVAGVYKQLLGAYTEGGIQGAMALATQKGLVDAGGNLLATLNLGSSDSAATVAQLQSMGIKVLSTKDNRVNIAFPMQMAMGMDPSGSSQQAAMFFNQLSSLPNVVGVLPPMP